MACIHRLTTHIVQLIRSASSASSEPKSKAAASEIDSSDDADDGTLDKESSSSATSSLKKKKWTLPEGADDGDRWNAQFIPTLLEYQGSRHDPWTFIGEDSVTVVQKIWDKVYGTSLPYVVEHKIGVHHIVSFRREFLLRS